MSTAIERTFFEQAPGFSPSENPFQRNPPKGVPGTFGSDGSCWSVTDLVLEKDKKEAHIYLSYAKGILQKESLGLSDWHRPYILSKLCRPTYGTSPRTNSPSLGIGTTILRGDAFPKESFGLAKEMVLNPEQTNLARGQAYFDMWVDKAGQSALKAIANPKDSFGKASPRTGNRQRLFKNMPQESLTTLNTKLPMLWWSGLMEKYKISIKWPGAILHSITLELQSFSSTSSTAQRTLPGSPVDLRRKLSLFSHN